jgi:hypothetical protein
MEAKKPGDAKWVSSADMKQYSQLFQITCPDGGTPQAVTP